MRAGHLLLELIGEKPVRDPPPGAERGPQARGTDREMPLAESADKGRLPHSIYRLQATSICQAITTWQKNPTANDSVLTHGIAKV